MILQTRLVVSPRFLPRLRLLWLFQGAEFVFYDQIFRAILVAPLSTAGVLIVTVPPAAASEPSSSGRQLAPSSGSHQRRVPLLQNQWSNGLILLIALTLRLKASGWIA